MRGFVRVALFAVLTFSATTAAGQCPGDCKGDGVVTVDELITAVNVALGTGAVTLCAVTDTNGDGQLTVNELITAVNNALNGCPSGQPTSTRTPTGAPTPTPTGGIVSAELLGIWSGLAVASPSGTPRDARIRIEVVGGEVVVTDLGGNLFVSGSTITVMPLTPTSLHFDMTTPTHVETLQLALNQNALNGTYASLTLTIPPTGSTYLLSNLMKEA